MKNYKIIFSHNEVMLCQCIESDTPPNGNIFFEHDKEKKMLIHAIIKADSETEAIDEARRLVMNYLTNSHPQKFVA